MGELERMMDRYKEIVRRMDVPNWIRNVTIGADNDARKVYIFADSSTVCDGNRVWGGASAGFWSLSSGVTDDSVEKFLSDLFQALIPKDDNGQPLPKFLADALPKYHTRERMEPHYYVGQDGKVHTVMCYDRDLEEVMKLLGGTP